MIYPKSLYPWTMSTKNTLIRPRQWDINFVRKFMLIVGPISSIFDFLTFFVMIKFFQAGESLFHTGWFIESIGNSGASHLYNSHSQESSEKPSQSLAHYLFSYSSSISCFAPLHSLGQVSWICRPSTAVLSCPGWHGDIVLTDRGTGKTVVLQALWLTLKHLNEDSFCARSELWLLHKKRRKASSFRREKGGTLPVSLPRIGCCLNRA